MEDNTLWFLFAYAIGTAFGWYLGVAKNVKDTAGLLIDKLIEEGYVRHRKNERGEIELLKINEE